MREYLVIVLFLLSIGLSAAAVLKLIAVGSVKHTTAILWAVVLAFSWSSWYVAQL